MVNAGAGCSRPLYFDNENEEFPYSCVGTCFIVKYRRKLWVLTAKHVLVNSEYQVSQAMVPYSLGGEHFIPIKGANSFDDIPNYKEATDIIVFEIDEDRLDRTRLDPSTVYDLDDEPETLPPLHGYSIVVHGFPDELNEVSYEEQTMYRQRLSIFASDPQRSCITGCVRVELLSDGDIANARGFSGGPVFLVSRQTNTNTPERLLGVIVNGSAGSRVLHFLNIVVFKNLVNHTLPQ